MLVRITVDECFRVIAPSILVLFYKEFNRITFGFFMVFNVDRNNADLRRQKIQRSVNSNLEIMWNEAAGSKIRYDSDTDMEVQSRGTRKLGQGMQYPGHS